MRQLLPVGNLRWTFTRQTINGRAAVFRKRRSRSRTSQKLSTSLALTISTRIAYSKACYSRVILKYIKITTLPFCSLCHAISKTVLVFAQALLFLVWVNFAEKCHFYNVNLTKKLQTAISWELKILLGRIQHRWVTFCISGNSWKILCDQIIFLQSNHLLKISNFYTLKITFFWHR